MSKISVIWDFKKKKKKIYAQKQMQPPNSYFRTKWKLHKTGISCASLLPWG